MFAPASMTNSTPLRARPYSLINNLLHFNVITHISEILMNSFPDLQIIIFLSLFINVQKRLQKDRPLPCTLYNLISQISAGLVPKLLSLQFNFELQIQILSLRLLLMLH